MTWLGLKSNFCHYLFVFIFRCMNVLALSLTPSISSNELFLMKGLLWRWREVLKEWMKTNRGRGGVKPFSMLTLWKIAWFFKQQVEFLLISCLAVAKSFMKKTDIFLNFFYISTCKNIFIVVIIDIYLRRKQYHLWCWVYKKIIIFSLFAPQFFNQKFISICV